MPFSAAGPRALSCLPFIQGRRRAARGGELERDFRQNFQNKDTSCNTSVFPANEGNLACVG